MLQKVHTQKNLVETDMRNWRIITRRGDIKVPLVHFSIKDIHTFEKKYPYIMGITFISAVEAWRYI